MSGWWSSSSATSAIEPIAATASRKLGSSTLRWMPSPSPDHRGRPCRAADSSSGERRDAMRLMVPCWSGLGVESALGLVRTGPAPGAGVLARSDRAGARRAADRAVAQLEQRVDRHLMALEIGVDVVLAPRG